MNAVSRYVIPWAQKFLCYNHHFWLLLCICSVVLSIINFRELYNKKCYNNRALKKRLKLLEYHWSGKKFYEKTINHFVASEWKINHGNICSGVKVVICLNCDVAFFLACAYFHLRFSTKHWEKFYATSW